MQTSTQVNGFDQNGLFGQRTVLLNFISRLNSTIDSNIVATDNLYLGFIKNTFESLYSSIFTHVCSHSPRDPRVSCEARPGNVNVYVLVSEMRYERSDLC